MVGGASNIDFCYLAILHPTNTPFVGLWIVVVMMWKWVFSGVIHRYIKQFPPIAGSERAGKEGREKGCCRRFVFRSGTASPVNVDLFREKWPSDTCRFHCDCSCFEREASLSWCYLHSLSSEAITATIKEEASHKWNQIGAVEKRTYIFEGKDERQIARESYPSCHRGTLDECRRHQ